MFELIEFKYYQVQVFKNACHESGQSLLWKQLLTYFGVLVADTMKLITRTSWHLQDIISLAGLSCWSLTCTWEKILPG